VPAAFGAAVIVTALALPHLGGVLERSARLRRAAPAASAIGDGVDDSLRMLRRGDPGLLGALLWWGADIAVLWATFHAFGTPPAFTVLVVAYFVGMLANTLPLPGGVGGVDGGMIGALVAFGVDPSLAVVSVLAYRGFAFWLPIVPGALAWVSLRRTVASWDAEPEPAPDPEARPAPRIERVAPAERPRLGEPAAAPRPAYVPVAA
jgi:hypothetical protein